MNLNESLCEILEVDTIEDSQRLEDFEEWDSLAQLCIVALAEQRGAKITNAELLKAETIGGVKKLIENGFKR